MATPVKRSSMAPAISMPHVPIITTIARELGIRAETHSQGWIIHLTRGPTTRIIYGYKFPLNTLGSGLAASDKAAASDIMEQAKIPHIRTHLVLNPSIVGSWAPLEGVFPSIHAYAAQYNNDVVCKPKDGTGGIDVFRTRTGRELEAAIGTIFKGARDAVICAYKPILREIRVIILDGAPEIIFEKIPPFVTGDGIKTVPQLIEQFLANLDPKQAETINLHIEPALRISKEVLSVGKQCRLHWKFNLGQGARAELLGGRAVHSARGERNEERSSLNEVIALAIRATSTLDIRFGSADIVEVDQEPNPQQRYRIMEVNSGVMMDHLIQQQGDFGRTVASHVFRAVINAMFPY